MVVVMATLILNVSQQYSAKMRKMHILAEVKVIVEWRITEGERDGGKAVDCPSSSSSYFTSSGGRRSTHTGNRDVKFEIPAALDVAYVACVPLNSLFRKDLARLFTFNIIYFPIISVPRVTIPNFLVSPLDLILDALVEPCCQKSQVRTTARQQTRNGCYALITAQPRPNPDPWNASHKCVQIVYTARFQDSFNEDTSLA